ncbi:methyltransferase domain-containing protein [Streptomyces iconiensis]|uniref:Protein-L-isoaspartate O-methyltransferase n=1 Tax=Streptomyces iconiensis TaxID=1384038 RepID=A0ABT7A5I2_9ACTN|nr:methyltransferase domain-containing protein [Streptomyces iconiensis]MDJ1136609.1 methyltransferase domain-containing protein [Streptomyces iconiensis]
MAASSGPGHQLVREMVAGGGLRDPAWRAAFEEVPRELFVPFFYSAVPGGDYERLWRDDPDPGRRARWREGVYTDQPLATRMRDGELLSSSSQPSLMALMLEYLDVRDGMDVLEIGTGPGYNAALLSHRLGDSHVTTVDLDPDITDAARSHLAAAGHRPRVITGDGARGCPAHAPYDRVIATCAVPEVPRAWIAQCSPGALVLTPLATGLLALRTDQDGCAQGHFTRTPAFFVSLRGTGGVRPAPPVPRGVPRRALRDDAFRFLLTLTGGQLEPSEAFSLWEAEGRPGRERYGVTVRDGRQWAWLDDPEGPYTWLLDEGGGAGEGTRGTAGERGA